MTKEELQIEYDKLKAAHEALKEESDQKIAELAKVSQKAIKGTVVIPGSVTIKVEDAETGKEVKKQIGIADNHPYISIVPGQRVNVPSAIMMKLATAGSLTEEENTAYPHLKKMGKDGVIEFLTELFVKGSGYIKVLSK